MGSEDGRILVEGAGEHNLKDIDVEIPRETFTVVTGVSGSGKSTFAFDTVFAEGQRRYMESLRYTITCVCFSHASGHSVRPRREISSRRHRHRGSPRGCPNCPKEPA